ncbi:MAG TPA: DUF1302 family protein [Candidatus Krumholzibacterium sp.]|nr:DUF1302 family protein [Candidatus Krumholzibacterium sp.]
MRKSFILTTALVSLLALSRPAAAEVEIGGFVQGLYGYGLDRDNPVESEMSASEVRLQMRLESYSDAAEYFGRLDFLYEDYLDPDYGLALREAYIKFVVFGKLDMKVGRQIATWGTGDLIFINDLFPKDYESFFSGRDDQYLKAPQNSIRASLYTGIASLDVVYTPRFSPDIIPTGERFSYFNPMSGSIVGGEGALFEPPLPAPELGNGELAARLSRYVGSVDAALYYYRGFYKNPVGIDPGAMSAFYPELQVFGASLRSPLLGGVFWAESGYYDSRGDSDGTDPFVPNSSIQGMAGFERAVNSSLTLNIQYKNEMMLDHESYLETLPASMTEADEIYHLLTSRMTMLFMMETLNLSTFVFYSPSEEDLYGRISLSYKVSDQVTAVAGANIFAGDSDYTRFGSSGMNDNVYMKFTYGL